ncbi:hypothetical protein [Sapientia aquatica]|uniref:Uncharacterized protein n=1 Tax=Sapientia aquatica TaxID=1549640 RepID=A0A4V3AU98_9BURK|nr:hypothetical protein [Sapientia aquatica]TDK63563.1 hypothetical protein E2I14_15290 [Sapientia aquatica]
MSNNTTLNNGTGGDIIQTIDNTTYKTQVITLANSTGVNIAAVKAASTAAVAADPALVVAISPNNTVGVTGTFWQATQPVSGTFWQTTQPVSIASMPTTAVTGTFWQATQPVSLSALPALVAGSAIVGKVGIDQTTVGTTNAVSLAQIGATTVVTGGLAGTLGVGGAVAAGGAITSNPVRIGGVAYTANPAAATTGTTANMMLDKMGRVAVVQGHVRDLVGKQATTITSSTAATTIITAGGAGVFNDITRLTVTNGSATATAITLSDGTYSEVFNCAAGGGFNIEFNPPMPATTAATAWTITCGTSVASIYVGTTYVKNL